jgi:hypothetical protein
MKLRLLFVFMLTILGGYLRFSATSFGLPDKFRPDEQYVVPFGFQDNWNPHFATYPAAQLYLNHFVLLANARLTGNQGDFVSSYSADGGALAYLLCRRTSAAFGTATIPAVYLAGELALAPEVGLYAAAITALATLHVRESKYATTDAGAVFWMTLSLAMVMGMIYSGQLKYYLLAGIFAGLAAATKYPAGVVVFAIGAGHFEARAREGRSLWRSLWDTRIYLAMYAAFGAFFLATPYFFLDWAQTTHDFIYQRGFVMDGLPNPQVSYGLDWLMLHAAPDSFGVTLMAFFIAACTWGIVRRRPGVISMLAMVFMACLSMTRSRYVFYRYLVFIMPPLALVTGWMLADLAETARRLLQPRYAYAAIAAVLALVLTPSLIRDIYLNRLLLQDDTRTMAKEWIEQHVEPGSLIGVSDVGNMCGKPQLSGSYRMVALDSVHTLRAKNIRWVLSDYFPPIRFYSQGVTDAQDADLKKNAKLVLELNPFKPGKPMPIVDPQDAYYAPIERISNMTRPGPIIRIWEIK